MVTDYDSSRSSSAGDWEKSDDNTWSLNRDIGQSSAQKNVVTSGPSGLDQDAADLRYVNVEGDSMTGPLVIASDIEANYGKFHYGLHAYENKITGVADGTDPTDAVNKGQLDTHTHTHTHAPPSLDDLTDVAAPANTPAGKVLGTTATGEWGPVDPPAAGPAVLAGTMTTNMGGNDGVTAGSPVVLEPADSTNPYVGGLTFASGSTIDIAAVNNNGAAAFDIPLNGAVGEEVALTLPITLFADKCGITQGAATFLQLGWADLTGLEFVFGALNGTVTNATGNVWKGPMTVAGAWPVPASTQIYFAVGAAGANLAGGAWPTVWPITSTAVFELTVRRTATTAKVVVNLPSAFWDTDPTAATAMAAQQKITATITAPASAAVDPASSVGGTQGALASTAVAAGTEAAITLGAPTVAAVNCTRMSNYFTINKAGYWDVSLNAQLNVAPTNAQVAIFTVQRQTSAGALIEMRRSQQPLGNVQGSAGGVIYFNAGERVAMTSYNSTAAHTVTSGTYTLKYLGPR